MARDVRLENVSKQYGSVTAVRDMSLTINAGECVTLLGPSGCGKTTTLNMIAGFLPADGGEIYIGSRNVSRLPAYKRNTGMVFQNYALFPHLTVFDNVAFGLRIRKISKEAIRDRVNTAVDLVQLRETVARYPHQLSGGQQQRVALARALVVEPDVLLLDEPLSNLDAKLRQEMRLQIADIRKRLGITSVYVTHDQEEALTLSDRIAVMNHGSIVQLGVPSDIYERPRSLFVATFVGDSNVLPGTVESFSGPVMTVRTTSDYTISAKSDIESVSHGMQVHVAVRPHRVRICEEHSLEAGVNSIPAVVRDISFLGDKIVYYCQAGDHRFTAITPNTGFTGGAARGQEVFVQWKVEHSRAVSG